MEDKDILLRLIKKTVHRTDPAATVILFGSYARGDYHKASDVDVLVLLDKESVTRSDEKRIKYPLYDIEFETGIIISPLVLSKKDWQSRRNKTPLLENISQEGLVL